MMSLLAFIILLPIIVFVHEFGHFIFARVNKVKVEAFSIGFGAPIKMWKDKHGTEWKICMIPLGGYVKMLGQSDTPETAEQKAENIKKLTKKEKAQSFEFKKRYQKASIVAAGPLFNFIFGFLIFWGLFFFKGVPNTPAVVMEVLKDSPAYTSGIKSGDTIIKVNKQAIENPREISNIIQEAKGDVIEIEVMRENKIIPFTINPKKEGDKYLIGISYSSRFDGYKKQTLFSSLKVAYLQTSSIVHDTLKSLGEIFIGSRSSKELGGIISIAKVSGDALANGLTSFVYLMAFLSISLGLFNLFPIPVLDGGYLFIYLIEGIIRRDIPEKVKEGMFFVGFMFIIFLLLLSNINDIIRIFG